MKSKLCGAFPLDAEGEQRQAAYDAESARADKAEAGCAAWYDGVDKLLAFIREKYPNDWKDGTYQYLCLHHKHLAVLLDQPHPGQRYLDLADRYHRLLAAIDEGLVDDDTNVAIREVERLYELAQIVEGCKESIKEAAANLRNLGYIERADALARLLAWKAKP